MDNTTVDFDEWFEHLEMLLSEEGINFQDQDAVREDFNAGKNIFDVCDEIKAEYE
jgi:hypothetical protein